jgi:HD-GYP domain-containing protein (c-di-GMP phosphodiesterase class II)
LIDWFGIEYSINESLVYSLQFSRLRTKNQIKANKSALSKDTSELSNFVESFRRELTDEIYNSQEFSIKLIQIPKISNTNRSDIAIEFVKWDELNEEDRSLYEQVAVIIKDKKVKVEAANIKRLKPGEVVAKVNERISNGDFKMHHHITLYKLFSIRPPNNSEDPFDTTTEYCLYDETHNDYVYQDDWVEFLVHFLQLGRFSYEELRSKETNGERLKIDDYKIE